MTSIATLPPGAMEVELRRELPDGGLITFASAPVGYPKADGEPRKKPYRAYHYHAPDIDKRKRLISVTTLLSPIQAKEGLPPWYEARGIEGAHEALRRGLVTPKHTPGEWVDIVRSRRLGGEAARDDAADRGLNIHAILEAYMETGSVPSVHSIQESHRGYFQGLCKWLLEKDPEPEMVEELVADPDAGFAGRRDLVARQDGRRRGYDAKTQRRGSIFSSAHFQCALYEAGALWCGDPPCDDLVVVVFSEDGDYNEMPCLVAPEDAAVALAFSALSRPVDAACAKRNRQRP